MKGKNKILVIALSLFFLAISSFGIVSTYSWYLSSNTGKEKGDMGTVDAAFLNSNSNLSFSRSGTSSKDFNIQNNSTIDTYVRIGYTVSYKNTKGEEVFQDTSNIDISSVDLSIGTKKVDAILTKNTTNSGYEKRFIIPISKSDGKNYYYKLSPGENITGKITLNAETSGINYPNIILATEVIQSTEKAIKEASEYGWDLAYVGK